MELGPRDIKQGEFVAVKRVTGEKVTLKLSDAATSINDMLKSIHQHMFDT